MSGEKSDQIGPNTWLIEEMYEQYLENPLSVSEAWREYFKDYRPDSSSPDAGPAPQAPQDKPPKTEQRLNELATPSAPPSSAPAPLADSDASQSVDKSAEPKTNGELAESGVEEAEEVVLKGADKVVAQRMQESLGMPTATSVRTVPAKLIEVNRQILNNHLSRTIGGKVSFTHLIGWAIVRGLAALPDMNVTYAEIDGKGHLIRNPHVNLGLAVDVKKKDGGRTLLVPNIKAAETLTFSEYFARYEEVVRKAVTGKLAPDDFAGTTVTITNPGMIGTVMSAPRLMLNQAAIIGVGSIGYPAEYKAADPEVLAEIGVGKVVTLTSTYDHRVIQGALSGEFLAKVESLILGQEDFYEDVFAGMKVPYVPVKWNADANPLHDSVAAEQKQARIFTLINIYRVRGHLIADLDPLDAKPPQMHPELDPATYGFTIWDLDRNFITPGLAGETKMKLSKILKVLRDAYCRSVGIEYMHISEPAEKKWIQSQVEGVSTELDQESKRHLLSCLVEAEVFETFLHKKYLGHKRFSIEGAEGLIPMLDSVLEEAGSGGVQETVMGMAHRGRLNVLANIVGKSYHDVFREFEGDIDPESAQGTGDVKYHLGATGTFISRSGKEMAITLASNPSHLEAVDPVVEGIARAKQDLSGGGEAAPVLPLLIHGDAAFAGQGVVAETLNLSELSGYRLGGTIHLVVNNQLGFTTGSNYGRSSTYATDIAKMVQAPIFHVNGEDPEACARVARLAFQFRQEFRKDVVIDMWCYRRWGHNEADEPAFTQPLMYRRIEGRRSVRKLYTERLVNTGDLSVEEAESSFKEFEAKLQQAFDETKDTKSPSKGSLITPIGDKLLTETSVDRATLDRVLKTISTVPEDFEVHPKLGKWLEGRSKSLESDEIDWALGEALALGSLLLDGTTIRMSGQDTRRGTFSQRHATLVDQQSGREFTPLSTLADGDTHLYLYDSLLSEFAAMGFEYGYTVGDPKAMVLWEAQFGDFSNGGQIIIDQFIAAGEDKWGQQSGLVLLLPHGYEGQGPEHSSARLERFLQLAAEDNIQVAIPSTPAQYFHLLRRQGLSLEVRKPLVVMTPKSFLRLKAATSGAGEFVDGGFDAVKADPTQQELAGVRRTLFCSGKIYYDLSKARTERDITDVAIVRLEQPYPWPTEALAEEARKYSNSELVWVQEEPSNSGAWPFVRARLLDQFGTDTRCISRDESASPATGSAKAHEWEQNKLLEEALLT